VITAPSGSGKTTLVKRLLKSCPHLEFSVSACTRLPRGGEVHGRDYYFFEEEQFKTLIEEDAFVEWEMVYPGKYYGTLKSELQRIWDAGKHPLVDIDVMGALAIKNQYNDICKTVFIEAPSLKVLGERLNSRGTETEHSLRERLSKAALELTFAPRFDCIIINDNLENATKELMEQVDTFAAC
jgi:guanylate kinase